MVEYEFNIPEPMSQPLYSLWDKSPEPATLTVKSQVEGEFQIPPIQEPVARKWYMGYHMYDEEIDPSKLQAREFWYVIHPEVTMEPMLFEWEQYKNHWHRQHLPLRTQIDFGQKIYDKHQHDCWTFTLRRPNVRAWVNSLGSYWVPIIEVGPDGLKLWLRNARCVLSEMFDMRREMRRTLGIPAEWK